MVERVLPTFPVQDGVLYRSSDLTTLYVQHVVLELQESTNLEKLKSAWKEVVRKCEILRLVIHNYIRSLQKYGTSTLLFSGVFFFYFELALQDTYFYLFIKG